MEIQDAEGQLCHSEMWKMGILKRKMAFYKHQENAFQMPMPAGQSLAWKMCKYRARSSRQQIFKAEATAWVLLASPSPATSHGKGEAASLQGWEATHHGALGFLLHQNLPDCCNCFVHLQCANQPCCPRPVASCPLRERMPRPAAWQCPCSDTDPAHKPAAPRGSPDFGCTGTLEGQGDRLNTRWECTTAVTKANRAGGCIHRHTPSRNTNVVVPLSSVLFRSHLAYCILFWSPQCQKKMLIEWKGAKGGPQR